MVNTEETLVQEMGQQEMAPYFCNEVRDFDICQIMGIDILAQGMECDVLAEVKVFGTWADVTQLFQAAGRRSG